MSALPFVDNSHPSLDTQLDVQKFVDPIQTDRSQRGRTRA